MDKGILQRYSVWAKESLEQQVEVSLKTLGINSDTDIARAKRTGDVTTIEGDPNSYSADLYQKRNEIINLVKSRGYKNVIEEFSYTWFNRFVALRFMEVHDFLGHGFRVLSNRSGGVEPEILQNLGYVKDDLKLDLNICSLYREQNKVEELFRYVLIQQCNALSNILPMLFSRDMGYLELLLPKTLLRGDTVITKMLEIPEGAFLEDVEIIGWLYQFYVADRRQQYRDAKTVTKELIPTLTQVFTTDWVVRYMAENSVGRIWMESYPCSSLHSQMKYYVEDSEQTEEIQRKFDKIKYHNVNPEDIRIIEPCCGSGHILAYVFDLLYKMYEEKGYSERNIPTLIISKNLFGLEIDKRAAQIASFTLLMKARAANNKFFYEKFYVEPNVYEIIDSNHLTQMQYRKHLSELNLLSDGELKEIDNLVNLFKNGKTVGSLIKIRGLDIKTVKNAVTKIHNQAVSNIFNSNVLTDGLNEIEYLAELATIMSNQYDVMITNPPYMSISRMEAEPKSYLIKEYSDSKTDLFAMFMETSFVKRGGFKSIVNPDSWMFLSSYSDLRMKLINSNSVVCLSHLGTGVFDAVVSTVMSITRQLPGMQGVFQRLVESTNKEKECILGNNTYVRGLEDFKSIPGHPFAYWITDSTIETFQFEETLASIAPPKQGMATADNDRFLRLWYEVNFSRIKFDAKSHEDALKSHRKWFPYNKGGSFRRWYGNKEYIVNWENDGQEIKNNFDENGKLRSRPQNLQYAFKPSLTWSDFTSSLFSVRYCEGGALFDIKGSSGFPKKEPFYILGLMNSKVIQEFIKIFNPTASTQVGDLSRIPVSLKINGIHDICGLSEDNYHLCKDEWDSFETSWDFKDHPLVHWSKGLWDATAIGATMQYYYGYHPDVKGSLELCYMLWQGECQDRFNRLKNNEEQLNRIFINIYGLQEELTPVVENKDVTVRLADKERDIKSLISYLIGVVMGRYSLSRDGLQYAGGQWDVLKYGEPLDDDGIVPIYTSLGMEDGLTTKIIELIKHIFGEDDYRNNIDFIADALGKKSNESSEETLNRYLNEGFYNDHLKIYQKRPIYWMFSSGKNSGFKCLIYMHRYNADTLARINGKYFLPESTRIKNELDEINTSISTAEGRNRIRLEKERQKLAAKYNEAIEYGQVLDHMANKFIDIDLDDGVKVNYAKFQGIELVTDNGTKVKKDLLVPIK